MPPIHSSLVLCAAIALISCVPEQPYPNPSDGAVELDGGAVGGGTGGNTGGGTASNTGGGTGGNTGGGTGGNTGGGTGGNTGGGTGGNTGGGTGGNIGGGAGGTTGGGSGGTLAGFTLGSPGCAAQTLDANVSVGGYMSDRYNWSDSTCTRRSASLVRNNAADPGGSNGGYLRELTFTINGTTRTARGTGANNWNGWGYVVNHYASSADNSKGRTGTFRTVLAGQHHAIHEFRVQMSPGGPVAATVHWFFATGRTEPVFSITYDVTAPADAVRADTRAPYGDLAFEGTPGPIGGIGWGDQYRFTTTGTGPVTMNTPWNYSAPNLVPFVRMWSSNVDAEMGAVQTQTFAQHVAGGDYGSGAIASCQGKTSASKGSGCSTGAQTMPSDWLWPFQLNQYELSSTTSSHRMAWGSSYGVVGRSSVSAFGKTFSGYPQVKYGVFLVVGAHSTSDTLARMTQVERLTATTVTGATWNPMYAAWDAPISTPFTVDPPGAAITSPIFRLTGFNGTALTEVTVNGVALLPGHGYFATIDAATQSVWVTLNGTLSEPITLRVR
jgi:hypothetical protein